MSAWKSYNLRNPSVGLSFESDLIGVNPAKEATALILWSSAAAYNATLPPKEYPAMEFSYVGCDITCKPDYDRLREHQSSYGQCHPVGMGEKNCQYSCCNCRVQYGKCR